MIPRVAPGRSPSAHARHARPRGTGTPHPTATRLAIRTHSPGPPLAMGARVTHSFRTGLPRSTVPTALALPSTCGLPGHASAGPPHPQRIADHRGRAGQETAARGSRRLRTAARVSNGHPSLYPAVLGAGAGDMARAARSALPLRRTLQAATPFTASIPTVRHGNPTAVHIRPQSCTARTLLYLSFQFQALEI